MFTISNCKRQDYLATDDTDKTRKNTNFGYTVSKTYTNFMQKEMANIRCIPHLEEVGAFSLIDDLRQLLRWQK